MPNMNWSELSHLQLGRYAEYYADASPHQDFGCDPGRRVCLEKADPGGKARNWANL